MKTIIAVLPILIRLLAVSVMHQKEFVHASPIVRNDRAIHDFEENDKVAIRSLSQLDGAIEHEQGTFLRDSKDSNLYKSDISVFRSQHIDISDAYIPKLSEQEKIAAQRSAIRSIDKIHRRNFEHEIDNTRLSVKQSSSNPFAHQDMYNHFVSWWKKRTPEPFGEDWEELSARIQSSHIHVDPHRSLSGAEPQHQPQPQIRPRPLPMKLSIPSSLSHVSLYGGGRWKPTRPEPLREPDTH